MYWEKWLDLSGICHIIPVFIIYFCRMDRIKGIKAKNYLSKDLCEMEAVKYIAFRYGSTPERVLERYLIQSGIIPSDDNYVPDYSLTANEMALFHDLDVRL